VANLVATGLTVAAWGYILYQGVVDPLGGINTLWPLFGIANQMLAAVALVLGTVVLFRMKKERFAWVTIVPATWLVICTLTAGWQKLFSPDAKIGFLAHARKFEDALNAGTVLAPAKSLEAMQRIVFNDRLDAALCALFMGVVASILVYGVKACLAARRTNRPTVTEVPFEPMPEPAK
jgi:carbon starvation protein